MCFHMNFHVSLRILIEGQWERFFNNFIIMTLTRMFSLKVLAKLLWRTLFSLNLVSYSLQHCKKNRPLLDFSDIFRTTTSKSHGRTATLPWVTLCEKCQYSEFFWFVFYSVSLRIQSECGKMRTRKTLNMGTFHAMLLL